MSDTAIKIENLKKQYRLGAIGGGTLRGDLQSWWARKRGKEDPNLKIGQDYNTDGDTFWALKGIDLEVKKGEALGIIGANGAGKSTLLKILSRVTAPNEGDIWINGRIASMLEVGTGFHGELTGRENIYMNGAILGMSKKEVDSKIESIIDFSECRQFIDTPVKRYSSGMYVKLAFAVASHLDAEIMVMDEVLAVGDVNFQKKCLGRMGEEAKGGKTVLYVSHNMSTISSLCSRCIVLEKGNIIYDGSTEKGIEVYTGSYRSNLPSIYDFSNFRRSGPEVGNVIYINKFCFSGKISAIFDAKESMSIEIEWKAVSLVENVHIRMSIYRVDDIPIGMVYSEKSLISKKGSIHRTLFKLEDLNLVEGVYFFWLEASYIDGAIVDLDYPQQRIYFEIKGSVNKFVWKTNIWGNVIHNTLDIVEDEILEEDNASKSLC